MLKCIINEIIEEWKIYYKNVTNRALFMKVRRALYTNYLDKQRIKSLQMSRRRCSLIPLGDKEKKNKKMGKNKKPSKKPKTFESVKNKRIRSASKKNNKNDALNIIMGEPLFNNISDDEDVQDREDTDKENFNEVSNVPEKKIDRPKKNIVPEKKIDRPKKNIVPDEIIENDKKLVSNDFIEEKDFKLSKGKKTLRPRKNSVVLKRNAKANISMHDLNEKLEFIKLGRNSLSKKEEDLKIDENDNNLVNITGDLPKVLEVDIQYSVTDNNPIDIQNKIYKGIEKQPLPKKSNKISDTFKKIEIKEQPDKMNKISDDLVINPPKVKDIKKENELLKKLFKKEKAKIEYKRNSVFLENKKEDLDVDKIIKQVFKKDKIMRAPIKPEFTTKINLKPKIEIRKPILDIKNPLEGPNSEIKKLTHSLENNEINLIDQNTNEIKLEERCKIDTSKLKKISHVFTENSKIYDVKFSKYIRDSPRSKNDLYKKVIDNQRRGISQNEYKSSTVIPHIKSDDEDSLLFIEPEYCKDPNINEKVCSQNHDILEEYFNVSEDINVEEIFPSIKDISNDSPNKWM
ncbi:hypothetical protein P3W45_000287 [Vairimorpha bombi]|jgi:hypothetical protein